MRILNSLREWRRRRRERADQTLVAARLQERSAEPSTLDEDAERLRLESRGNTLPISGQ